MTSASRTALLVAAYRARASARPDPLVADPWAAALAGADGERYAAEYSVIAPFTELWIAVRTAFIDSQVRQLADGQVVLLGAGLDTRAARLARDGLRFFEVDHPATQREKRRRLERLTGYPLDAATHAPCDFERDDFVERLVASGFDRAAPALFVWEGVTMYLTESAVRATLQRIGQCHPDSVVVYDYVNRNVATGQNLRPIDERSRQWVAQVGEPMRFGVNDPLPMLFDTGFRHVRTVSFDQLCLSLTGEWVRERGFRFQSVALASPRRPVPPA